MISDKTKYMAGQWFVAVLGISGNIAVIYVLGIVLYWLGVVHECNTPYDCE